MQRVVALVLYLPPAVVAAFLLRANSIRPHP
jgi:hypothetical protein